MNAAAAAVAIIVNLPMDLLLTADVRRARRLPGRCTPVRARLRRGPAEVFRIRRIRTERHRLSPAGERQRSRWRGATLDPIDEVGESLETGWQRRPFDRASPAVDLRGGCHQSVIRLRN